MNQTPANLLQFFIWIHLTNIAFAQITHLPVDDISKFKQFIGSHDLCVVYFQRHEDDFTSNWYKDAAIELLQDDPPIILAEMLCFDETCRTIHAQYESIKVYKFGKQYIDYVGPEDAVNLVRFLRDEAPCNLRILNSVESVDYLLNIAKVACVIGFFDEENELEDVFMRTSHAVKNRVIFGFSSSEEVMAYYEVRNGVALFRPMMFHNIFEEDFVEYSGSPHVEDLVKFIVNNDHGLVGYRTPYNADQFKQPLVVVYYNFNISTITPSNLWRNKILPIAAEFQGQLTFGMSQKRHFLKDLVDFGHSRRVVNFTDVVVMATAKNGEFVLKEILTEASLKAFCEKILNGTITKFIKSGKAPRTDGRHYVEAVGKTFDKIISDDANHYLIHLYGARCISSRVALQHVAKLMSQRNVGFIAMDAETNHVPEPYEFDDCPSIYFKSRSSNAQPVKYEGGLSHQQIHEFILQHMGEDANIREEL